ncbi:MAG: sulfurtransferase-like selenium metabolism protein YedF [Anaerolineae bacterium]|nr:sulfurtransferase-like selenium metabolism protein YedF [Anaerolineae bacterium]
MQTVDARGLPCPQPVILTRQALEKGDEVTTIVSDQTALHNVTRMAEKAGYGVWTEPKADGIYIHIGDQCATPAERDTVEMAAIRAARAVDGPLVLVVPGERMGRGPSDELGDILARAFFHTLGEVEPLPETIVFFNSGVKLAVEGSPVLEDLRALREQEIEILVCGTCLGYFELKDRLAVGEVSNMYTIAETMLKAGKVVSL